MSNVRKLLALLLAALLLCTTLVTGALAAPVGSAFVVPEEDASSEVIAFSPEQLRLIPANPDFEFYSNVHAGGGSGEPGEASPITWDYYMAQYPVTNAMYKEYLDDVGGEVPQHWANGTYPEGKANHPVLYVSYYDAVGYCEWLGEQFEGWTFRLPTDAEWENACFASALPGHDEYIFPWGTETGFTYDQKTGEFTNQYGLCCNAGLAAAILDPKGDYGPDYVLTYVKDKLAGSTITAGELLTVSADGRSVQTWANHTTGAGFIFTDLYQEFAAGGGLTLPVDVGYVNEYGLYSCIGNAWTWTNSWVVAMNGAEYGQLVRSVRGGSWYATTLSCAASNRGEGRAEGGAYHTIGFRIAATPAGGVIPAATYAKQDGVDAIASASVNVPEMNGEVLAATKDYPSGVNLLAAPTAEKGSVTMTVDGVETGMEPGVYNGHVVFTVAEENLVEYSKGGLIHPFRQAIYVDESGLVEEKSVLTAVAGRAGDDAAKGITIRSQGDNFNGLYVAGGDYLLADAEIVFHGDGGNDFAGYGAAVMATGENTTLTIDNSRIETKGVVRSTLVPAGGANVIVKNSTLSAAEGVLPEDYIPSTSLGYMKSVPWMLGLSGNCRATNMLGANTQETLINSTVSTEAWGVLSVDDCSNVKLTGINSSILSTGEAAYGCYGIGAALDRFYGCDFDLATYAAIMTGGGRVQFDDSTAENVAMLNEELELGLSEEEMAAIEPRGNTITTGGSAIMIFDASGGSAEMGGSTVVNAGRACFLTRSGVAEITVDGAAGAELNSDIGVILQMIDLDKAPRVNQEINGIKYSVYPGPYAEPYESYEDIELSASAEPTEATDKDVDADFSNIVLNGDFYNGTTGAVSVQNLDLSFDNVQLAGVISASFAKHEKDELYPEDWQMIGVVENTVCPAVNNGVLLTMTNGSVWTVTGESYITRLEIDDSSSIQGIMTVDGVATPIVPGTYTGEICLKPRG